MVVAVPLVGPVPGLREPAAAPAPPLSGSTAGTRAGSRAAPRSRSATRPPVLFRSVPCVVARRRVIGCGPRSPTDSRRCGSGTSSMTVPRPRCQPAAGTASADASMTVELIRATRGRGGRPFLSICPATMPERHYAPGCSCCTTRARASCSSTALWMVRKRSDPDGNKSGYPCELSHTFMAARSRNSAVKTKWPSYAAFDPEYSNGGDLPDQTDFLYQP